MNNLDIFKWKVKRWLHYWVGNEPYKSQLGDYIILREPIDPLDSKIGNEYRTIFKDQLKAICQGYKYQPVGNMVLIVNNPSLDSTDPLLHIGTIAWKQDVIIHTRKSWRKKKKL